MTDHTDRPGHCDRDAREVKVDRMCELLEQGRPLTVACRMVGYSAGMPAKWRRWARGADGQPPKEEYIRIVERLSIAQAKGASDHYIESMRDAAMAGDWRAAAWMIANLYPWLVAAPGDIEPDDPEQAKQEPEERAGSDKIAQLAKWAVQAGLVTIEELTGVASRAKPTAAAEPATPRVDAVTAAVTVALSAGEREHQELTDTICRTLDCQPEAVFAAYDRLGVETRPSQGSKTLLHLRPQPRSPSRTTSKAVVPPDPTVSLADRTQVPATDGSQPDRQSGLQGWLSGGTRGTGDVIRDRERRG
jgi:hypothetical protein